MMPFRMTSVISIAYSSRLRPLPRVERSLDLDSGSSDLDSGSAGSPLAVVRLVLAGLAAVSAVPPASAVATVSGLSAALLFRAGVLVLDLAAAVAAAAAAAAA